MGCIGRTLTIVALIVFVGCLSSFASETAGRHFPFTAVEDADGARYVWWTLGKSIAPYRYVPAKKIPECGYFARSPKNKPQPGDIAWWPEFVAIYEGDDAPKESNLYAGQGKMSLMAMEKKHGPVNWYRYLIQEPSEEPSKEKIAALEKELSALRPVLDGYPPNAKSKEDLESVKRDWEKAEKELLSVRNDFPRSAETERLIGELYRFGHNMDLDGAWTKSESHYKRALDLSPWSISSLVGLGALYVNTGFEHAAKAEALFREALRISSWDEPSADAYSGLFFAYYYQGRLSDAINAADEYLKLRPSDKGIAHLLNIARDKVRESSRKTTTRE
jgi:tetratricopeptide (TPR) repeat protein